MFRVGTSFIFCSINARSSSVTLNLICTVRFLPSMRSRSFPLFRGFGTLPNKPFSTDVPQRRRAKIRKGYPFPMLAKKLFPFIPTTPENLILPNLRKRKTLQSAKITTLPKIHIQFCGTFSFVLFFDFRYLFCGGCYNPKPRIAYPVEQRVKLPTLRVLFSGLV